MKVVDNRKIKAATAFADLAVGQAYYDNNGILCIKTSDYEAESNCIAYVKGEGWHEDSETRSNIVRPATTTLTVEG